MIDNLDPKRIPKQKLMTMNEIIHSELFKYPECRRVLLPSFIGHIRRLLAANEEVGLVGGDAAASKDEFDVRLFYIVLF